MSKSPTNWQSILTRKIDGKLETIEQFRFVWLKQLKTCREQILAANLLGGTFVYNSSSRQFKEQPSTLLSTKSSNKRARTQDDDKSTDMYGLWAYRSP